MPWPVMGLDPPEDLIMILKDIRWLLNDIRDRLPPKH